jgi:hypothetical protein
MTIVPVVLPVGAQVLRRHLTVRRLDLLLDAEHAAVRGHDPLDL